MAAVDYFLKLDGVEGESKDDRHKNEIDIESFSFGVSNSASAIGRGGGGGGAGKATFQDLHFTASISKASPVLMLACATGQHIKEAKLTCRKSGEGQLDFYVITLSDCLVSSFQQSGAETGGALPLDDFTLDFARIVLEYKSPPADGTAGSVVRAGWDLAQAKKI